MKDWLYKFYKLFSTIPQRLGYDAVDARLHGVYSFHFWYRQTFHVLGGVLVGYLFSAIIARRFGLQSTIYGYVLLAICVTVMEFMQASGGQKWIKTLLDPVFWGFGYWLSAWAFGVIK